MTARSTTDRSTEPATGRRRGGGSPSDTPADGEVVAAVRRDLEAIAARDPEIARSTLAASALALARELDKPGNSATSKSMCARALLETMDRLRELAPEEETHDALDALLTRREARIGR